MAVADPDQTWLAPDMKRKLNDAIGLSQQDRLLNALSDEVGRGPAVFTEAQKLREQHQKHLSEMLEETLRQIKKVRQHLVQKSKQVMDTTKSYTAKFDHELNSASESLRYLLGLSFARMTEAVDGLETAMTEAEAALQRQHEFRCAHIEETLGPIRDEAQRLTLAVESESKSRRRQEEAREKLLADETEAIMGLLDAEKFDREQKLMAFERWADAEQQRAAKRQYQLDKEARDVAHSIRVQHQASAQERITTQHGIIESIASFVHTYRSQMSKDAQQLQGLEEILRAAGR